MEREGNEVEEVERIQGKKWRERGLGEEETGGEGQMGKVGS